MKAITRKTLDDMAARGCSKCGGSAHGHDEVYLHSKCHTGSPTWASYKNGELTISCAECKDVIAVVKVAP